MYLVDYPLPGWSNSTDFYTGRNFWYQCKILCRLECILAMVDRKMNKPKESSEFCRTLTQVLLRLRSVYSTEFVGIVAISSLFCWHQERTSEKFGGFSNLSNETILLGFEFVLQCPKVDSKTGKSLLQLILTLSCPRVIAKKIIKGVAEIFFCHF